MALLQFSEETYICLYSGCEDNCPIYKMKFFCDECIKMGADKNLAAVEQQYEQIKTSWPRLHKRLTNEPELKDECRTVVNFVEMILCEDETVPAFHAIALKLLRILVEDLYENENLEQNKELHYN